MFKSILFVSVVFFNTLCFALNCNAVVEQDFIPAAQEFFDYDLSDKIHIVNAQSRRGLSDGDHIYVECLDDREEFLNVLTHELGHVVHNHFFSPKYKLRKSKFYDFERPIYYSDKSLDFYRLSYLDHYTLKGSTLSLDFVSLYAMTDPFEDFAESFMMYMRYRSEFKQISLNSRILGAKYSFFEQHFGNTKEVLVKPTPSLYLSSVIRPYDATLVHRKPSIGFVNP